MHVSFLKQIARSYSARALPHKARTNGAKALAALRERARRTAEARAPAIGGVCRAPALHEKNKLGLGYIYKPSSLFLHDSDTKVSLKTDFSWSIAL